ncbi:MAG: SpoIIE family protein phosphatase [Gammaproteobacteria bacterium]|nr:SpoIIE family protein phosphatase [Gammaproteobacteria bacterium]
MVTLTATSNNARIPFLRTIGARLSLLVVILILVTIVSMSIINYRTVRSSILDEVHVGLVLQNDSMREILQSAVDYQHGRIDALTNQLVLQQNLGAFVDNLISHEEVQANTAELLVQLQRFWSDVLDIQVLSPTGNVIASTELATLGTSMASDERFLEGQSGPFLSLLRLIDDPNVTHVSGPVRTADGELVGVVIADIEGEFLRDAIDVLQTGHETSSVRLGMVGPDSELRYLFVTNGLDSAELVNVNDNAMQLAVAERAGFLDGMFDHRGVEVVAAYRPIEIQASIWGLVSQVDSREIYLPVRQAFWTLLLTAILFITISVVFAILFVRRSLLPINDLAEATGRLKQDDVELDITTESQDEFGVLSRAFNAILKERSNYTQSLRQEVSERTQELERSNTGLQRVVERVETQNDLMERDLRRAEIFQKSLLPKSIPDMPGFSLAAMYLPGTAVGGDLYDVVHIDDQHVAFLIADSAGHGASAAMLSVLFKLRLESPNANELLDPVTLFTRVNRDFVEDLAAPGVFVTALLLILNTRTREVTMASAGHPPLLLVRANGDVTTLERTGPGLGLSVQASFDVHRFCLVDGDQLLVYTDGLFDVGDDEPPTLDALADVLRRPDPDKPVLEQLFELGSGSVDLVDRDDVTLCLLSAVPDRNWVRTGSRPGSDMPLARVENTDGRAAVEYAETEQITYLYLTGRVTWTYGESFFDAATSVLDEHRPIVIEFKSCEYLDSAMLGTLHQIVERATQSDIDVKLQNVSDEVKNTFVELGLGDVLNHIVEEPVWTPPNSLPLSASGRLDRNTRVISAHDALAHLNKKNKEMFEDVVEQMRSDYLGQSSDN